jgi:itaconate CoA-transferase
MADWLTVPLLNHENGNPPKRMGLAHPSVAPYGVFVSKDAHEILISIQSEREWRVFSDNVLRMPELKNDERYNSMVARVKNRKLTDDTVSTAFAKLTRDELLKRLSDADIAFAEVNTMDGLSTHPHLRRVHVESPNGVVSYPAPAMMIVGETRKYGAIPNIGSHSVDDALAASKKP